MAINGVQRTDIENTIQLELENIDKPDDRLAVLEYLLDNTKPKPVIDIPSDLSQTHDILNNPATWMPLLTKKTNTKIDEKGNPTSEVDKTLHPTEKEIQAEGKLALERIKQKWKREEKEQKEKKEKEEARVVQTLGETIKKELAGQQSSLISAPSPMPILSPIPISQNSVKEGDSAHRIAAAQLSSISESPVFVADMKSKKEDDLYQTCTPEQALILAAFRGDANFVSNQIEKFPALDLPHFLTYRGWVHPSIFDLAFLAAILGSNKQTEQEQKTILSLLIKRGVEFRCCCAPECFHNKENKRSDEWLSLVRMANSFSDAYNIESDLELTSHHYLEQRKGKVFLYPTLHKAITQGSVTCSQQLFILDYLFSSDRMHASMEEVTSYQLDAHLLKFLSGFSNSGKQLQIANDLFWLFWKHKTPQMIAQEEGKEAASRMTIDDAAKSMREMIKKDENYYAELCSAQVVRSVNKPIWFIDDCVTFLNDEKQHPKGRNNILGFFGVEALHFGEKEKLKHKIIAIKARLVELQHLAFFDNAKNGQRYQGFSLLDKFKQCKLDLVNALRDYRQYLCEQEKNNSDDKKGRYYNAFWQYLNERCEPHPNRNIFDISMEWLDSNLCSQAPIHVASEEKKEGDRKEEKNNPTLIKNQRSKR